MFVKSALDFYPYTVYISCMDTSRDPITLETKQRQMKDRSLGIKQKEMLERKEARRRRLKKRLKLLDQKHAERAERDKERLEARAARNYKSLKVSEKRVFDIFSATGATILRNGWPDFAVKLDNEVVFVEVKKGSNDRPRPEQDEMHDFLRSLGFKVIVVNSTYPNLYKHIHVLCESENIKLKYC